jgi:hypothetical protein
MQLQKRVMQIMAEDQLDALVYPHQQCLVVPVGERQVGRNGVVASVTGFPAIALPGGLSKSTATAPIGVPVGIEFLGRPWSEPVLIRIAYAFEQATRFHRPPPQHSAAEVSETWLLSSRRESALEYRPVALARSPSPDRRRRRTPSRAAPYG